MKISDNTDVQYIIDELDKTIQYLSVNHEFLQLRDVTGNFMRNLFLLSLALHAHPKLTEDSSTKNFIYNSSRDLPLAMGHINFFCSMLENRLYGEWVYEEWLKVCSERSAIEFFFEIYNSTDVHYFFNELTEKIAVIDDLFKQKVDFGVYTPYERIPENMPPSHWWWWYPEKPSQ